MRGKPSGTGAARVLCKLVPRAWRFQGIRDTPECGAYRALSTSAGVRRPGPTRTRRRVGERTRGRQLEGRGSARAWRRAARSSRGGDPCGVSTGPADTAGVRSFAHAGGGRCGFYPFYVSPPRSPRPGAWIRRRGSPPGRAVETVRTVETVIDGLARARGRAVFPGLSVRRGACLWVRRNGFNRRRRAHDPPARTAGRDRQAHRTRTGRA